MYFCLLINNNSFDFKLFPTLSVTVVKYLAKYYQNIFASYSIELYYGYEHDVLPIARATISHY